MRMVRWIMPVLMVFSSSCRLWKSDGPKLMEIEGQAVGSKYQIQILVDEKTKPSVEEQLRIDTEKELLRLVKVFSIYDVDSEISKFNQTRVVGEPIAVSEELFQLVDEANHVFLISKGAFDIALSPLIERWGFGVSSEKDHSTFQEPTEAEIRTAKSIHTIKNLKLHPQITKIEKKFSDLELDASAMAKGAVLDLLSQFLKDRGIRHGLLRFSSEAVAFGLNPKGEQWSIPLEHFPDHQMKLDQRSLCTTGGYQNYFVKEGRRYVHVLDPRTGRPVQNDIASVTILAPRSIQADAISTAVFVLGQKEGLELVERLPQVEAMITLSGPNGEVTRVFSAGFQNFVVKM